MKKSQTKPNLPDDLLAAMRHQDVEVPGEERAIQSLLAWLSQPRPQIAYANPDPLLPIDKFAWSSTTATTTGNQT